MVQEVATLYTVLITGSNRGIGHSLVTKYLLRPHHVVIACIRNPSNASTLISLPHDPSTTLIISHIDSADHSSPSTSVASLKSQGITHFDLVIANAGICKCFPTVAEANLDDVREHYEINVLGPLALFQAILPLLKASVGGEGKFVAISSIGASIGGMELRPVPSAAYGPSKAALNYIMRKAHFENQDVCVFVIEPGSATIGMSPSFAWSKTDAAFLSWAKTEMGNIAAKILGEKEADIEVEDSVNGIIAAVDTFKRELCSGRFLSYKGGEYPW